jgi:hypothetical protein
MHPKQAAFKDPTDDFIAAVIYWVCHVLTSADFVGCSVNGASVVRRSAGVVALAAVLAGQVFTVKWIRYF